MSNWQEAAGENRWDGIKARRKSARHLQIWQYDRHYSWTHVMLMTLLHAQLTGICWCIPRVNGYSPAMYCISTCGSFSPPHCQSPATGVLPPLKVQTLFYLRWVYKPPMWVLHCTVSKEGDKRQLFRWRSTDHSGKNNQEIITEVRGGFLREQKEKAKMKKWNYRSTTCGRQTLFWPFDISERLLQ